jgi:23S rRNA (adenine2503-C2)-methyltransferase
LAQRVSLSYFYVIISVMKDIKELTLEELKGILADWGEKSFRSGQIFSWVYKKGALDFEGMSDLPGGLKKKLKENFSFSSLKLIKKADSRDGTEKFLFALKDAGLIEAVVIPAKGRATACLSTQVGCKYRCNFCASGLGGLKRNLACGEILEELLYLKNNSKIPKITHVVFMGIGEPLDNYGNVLKSIRIINSKEAFDIGARRITISTCGIIPGIKRLAEENLQVELSVSLHASDDRLRSRLMPVNKIYPLGELISTLNEYIEKTDRQVTFEYALFKNLNSDLQNAQKLVKLLKDLRLAKVNLIPSNFIKECGVEPPGKLDILFFKDYIMKHGLHATLRKSRGEDIDAACGQLRFGYEKK